MVYVVHMLVVISMQRFRAEDLHVEVALVNPVGSKGYDHSVCS
jgi:hypothetical protein